MDSRCSLSTSASTMSSFSNTVFVFNGSFPLRASAARREKKKRKKNVLLLLFSSFFFLLSSFFFFFFFFFFFKQEAQSGLFSCACVRKFYGIRDKKMSDMEKSYSFHSIIVPTNPVVTIECFINQGCTTREPVIILCVIYT